MVGAGVVMLLAVGYALLLTMGEQLEEKPKFLRAFIWLIPLPYIANTAGWFLTEFGRYPWIVYGLMKLESGVSISVSAGMVALTLIGFTLLYGALMAATIYLLAKYARLPDQPKLADEMAPGQTAVALIGE